ncbi:hypothetical protein MMYC01_201309 [Madurella mycetomatis]|uniref:Uncharacterized protein n=1 Tax=Madurella mycetomatis TaxID=100816 RepID=A0A175WFR3_9PEZI|nr:hypothetical protein MMYC01_201309 [Madurella mycetomatis]
MDEGRRYMRKELELLVGTPQLTVTLEVGASLPPPLLWSLTESEQWDLRHFSRLPWPGPPEEPDVEQLQCTMAERSDYAMAIMAAISQLLMVVP